MVDNDGNEDVVEERTNPLYGSSIDARADEYAAVNNNIKRKFSWLRLWKTVIFSFYIIHTQHSWIPVSAVSHETEEQHSNPLYGGTFDARADEYATVDVSTKRKIIAENEMAHFKKIQKA